MQPVGPPSDQPLKVDRTATPDSLKQLLAETDDKSEYAGCFYEDLADTLVKKSARELAEVFEPHLRSQNSNKVCGALYGLGRLRDARDFAIPLILRMLDDRRNQVVLAALGSLDDIGYEGHASLVDRFWTSTDPYLKAAALRLARKGEPGAFMRRVSESLSHSEAIVRQEACDQVEDNAVLSLRPLLERLRDDPDEKVRNVAANAIERLDQHPEPGKNG